MLYLLVTMLERVGIIVTVAFVTTRLPFFRNMMEHQRLQGSILWKMILFFGVFGIIGTYTGLSVNAFSFEVSKWTVSLNHEEALANSRVIGVVIGGLLGGWKVGLGAGLLAGVHRFTLGGFTALACGIASIVAGLIAGLIRGRTGKNAFQSLWIPFFVGMLAETVQMAIILGISKPFEAAFSLVEKIGLPMVIANGIGSALFIIIVKSVFDERENVGAEKTQKALLLAKLTTSHLRFGLNQKTAQQTCDVLWNEVGASAVAITNKQEILGYVGEGIDHHYQGQQIQTNETRGVIEKGKTYIARNEAVHCQNPKCSLQTAVIAPLNLQGETVGTLKCYFEREDDLSRVTEEYITGLAALLSQQLELSDAERVNQLAKEAEIKSLQAQISPHFLFNALNTIVSMIRSDPNEARKLLISLSRYLRQNIQGSKETVISLSQELEHVNAYLSIEEARFKDTLTVHHEIEEGVLYTRVPPMTLQPLVENAIKHGLKDKQGKRDLAIVIKKENNGVRIEVTDNGVGIRESRRSNLATTPVSSEEGAGIGLANINQRLWMIFGKASHLSITSVEGEGTSISFWIPFKREEETYE